MVSPAGKGLDVFDKGFAALDRRVRALEESLERVREACVPSGPIERLANDIRELVDDLTKALRGG